VDPKASEIKDERRNGILNTKPSQKIGDNGPVEEAREQEKKAGEDASVRLVNETNKENFMAADVNDLPSTSAG